MAQKSLLTMNAQLPLFLFSLLLLRSISAVAYSYPSTTATADILYSFPATTDDAGYSIPTINADAGYSFPTTIAESRHSFPTTSATVAAGDNEFIRASCETTLYPVLCYTSLSGYASAVQQDPAKLARAAIGVSLSKAKRAALYFSNATRSADYGANPRSTSALRDCFSVFGDAVDQIRRSLKQMRRIGGSGESVRFQMSNVQTWMSAALTNEETCTDGFEDVPDGSVKTDVCDRAVKVKEATSNALALVNSYVTKITRP